MGTIEILVYGVFSGVLGGGLASVATFLIIERNSKKIQKVIKKEAKEMSEQMKLNGLNEINSNMTKVNKNWN